MFSDEESYKVAILVRSLVEVRAEESRSKT